MESKMSDKSLMISIKDSVSAELIARGVRMDLKNITPETIDMCVYISYLLRRNNWPTVQIVEKTDETILTRRIIKIEGIEPLRWSGEVCGYSLVISETSQKL